VTRVCIRTQTLNVGNHNVTSSGRDTRRARKNPHRSNHFVRVVQSTYVYIYIYIYAEVELGLSNVLFSFKISFLPHKIKRKRERYTKTLIPATFEPIDPATRVLNYFLFFWSNKRYYHKIIKAVIIIEWRMYCAIINCSENFTDGWSSIHSFLFWRR